MNTLIHGLDAGQMSDKVLRSLQLERNGVPIYVQIREQMLRLIGAGVLSPGQQMPTMRQLAVTLKTDLNTVRHAYDELARSGAITVVRARGTFVAERQPKAASQSAAQQLSEFAKRTIGSAAAIGLDPRAVAHRILQLTASNGDEK